MLLSLRRQARLSLVPGICIAFALASGAYADKDKAPNNATIGLQTADQLPLGAGSRLAPRAGNGSPLGGGCPASTCDGGDCKLTQSLDPVTDGANQIACGVADVGTTPNGWARCYNLVDEGVTPGVNFTVESVTFGVQQCTADGVNIDVIVYLACFGCPPVAPGADAVELALVSITVDIADEGTMITVPMPAGTVVPAGSDMVVEIVSVDDGTVEGEEFSFRTMSNDGGQCGPSYLRAADCGFAEWTDLADLGFPDSHLLQSVTGSEGGVATVECPDIPEACGKGAGACGEANGSPGCEDEACCAAVCELIEDCCTVDWDQFCADFAIELGCALLPCPVSSCDEGGDCKLTQSQNGFLDSGNQVACGADGNTTANGWARCYNLVEEGVPAGMNLTINSVEFFVQQATIDGINVNVVLYLDCDGCPPGTPGLDATELASVSLVVDTGDVGSFITVAMPAGTVVPAGTDLIVEIENKDDGTADPVFAFRVGSNDVGQCAGSYLRAADCGLDWTDLADIGFPDAHLLQSVSATVGGAATVECAKIPKSCGKGAGPCDEAHGTPGCSDVFCCAAVCEIVEECCTFEWEQFCVDLAIEIGCVVAPCVPPKGLEGTAVPSSEDFDSYADGFLLEGVNGWGAWDDTASVRATVSSDVARSAPHSVKIDNTPDDDCVQQYTGAYCEGQWVYTIWQYVPSEMIGSSFFILLNTYADGGDKNWSTQVQFSATDGTVVADFDGETLPLTPDEWVEIRVEIDLDADTQDFFYGGDLLYSDSWSDRVSGGGERNIRAVDLYANTSTAVYYDDVSLVPGGALPCPWDLDDNGSVGATDLLSLLVNWGPYEPCPPFKPADFDTNCTVGATDLLALLVNWGPCP